MLDRLNPFASARSDDADSGSTLGRTALISGSMALGAYVTSALLRRVQRSELPPANQIPPMLDGTVREMELMEGRVRFYERPGTGAPLVLLHSFNAAAASHEMLPLYDHLTATTERPVYAIDWLGFGLSERPPVAYRPEIYLRQLRRFLSEIIKEPADLIALSLGGEYAALIACEVPFLVRRLALIAPTALSAQPDSSTLRRVMVRLAGRLGAFELFFYRLTERDTLRRFYAEQVFLDASTPEALVDHAYLTSHVRGAHHAPRHFVDGSLFLGDQARRAYAQLSVPTLLVVPETAESTVQRFDRLDAVLSQNATLRAEHLGAGLMPQWEAPELLFPLLDAFLIDAPAPVRTTPSPS
ncbi:MAG: alpha/beta fold hydrolase [Bacteroidetes bacterium]|jgi:pimeloyl-ACP methyl ester carboxylesterase|nr:alpha/beta fold hydrolase [Bacteroidota bacterium]